MRDPIPDIKFADICQKKYEENLLHIYIRRASCSGYPAKTPLPDSETSHYPVRRLTRP